MTMNPINLQKNEHLEERFSGMNPYQTVPCLRIIDTGEVITESGAILTYLSTLPGVEPVDGEVLQAATPLGQVRILEALLHHGTLARNVSETQRPAINIRRSKPELTLADQRAVAAKTFDELKSSLWLLNSILCRQSFIAGNEFTLADYMVAGEISRLSMFKALYPDAGACLADYPHVLQYEEGLKSMAGYDAFVKPLENLVPFVAEQ